MKKCPFCAEEIQDAAIKCRFCNSFLDGSAPAAPAPSPPGGAPEAAGAAEGHGPAPFARAARPEVPTERKVLYEGIPSWRAYVGQYALAGLEVVLGAGAATVVGGGVQRKLVVVLVGLAVAAIHVAVVTFLRRSTRFRVLSTAIETERGVLSKTIDVLQLWRVRDVRYRQGVLDRILGIAHIEVFAQDMATPHLEITGMPASRQLFEQLRDSIEIQRQAKNVYGVVS